MMDVNAVPYACAADGFTGYPRLMNARMRVREKNRNFIPASLFPTFLECKSRLVIAFLRRID
jgi:hypothetical protein